MSTLTKEHINKLHKWSSGGGKAVGEVRCDKCGQNSKKFYVEIVSSIFKIPFPTRKGNKRVLPLKPWRLCLECAGHITQKDPLRIRAVSTGLPTGKTL